MFAEVDKTDLEKRIFKLEYSKKVAVYIVTALGISGGLLLTLLVDARAQIAELESKVSGLKPMVDASITKIEAATEAGMHRIAATVGAPSLPRNLRTQSGDQEVPVDLGGEELRTRGSEQNTDASLTDVEVAQNRAKEMQKSADKSQCKTTQPQDWHRAQTVYGVAEQNKEDRQYGGALEKFTEARTFYESCMKAGI